MKQAIFAFLLMVTSMVTVSAQTTEISDVTLQNTIEVDGATLHLNGAGVRSKYFLSLYVGSLYIRRCASNRKVQTWRNDRHRRNFRFLYGEYPHEFSRIPQPCL